MRIRMRTLSASPAGIRQSGEEMELCLRIADAAKARLQLDDLLIKLTSVTSATRIAMVANRTVDLECGTTTNTIGRQERVAFAVTTFIAASRFLAKRTSALRTFDEAGGKRITFEYVMIDGVNDGLAEADQLAELVREFTAFVNLIPFNPIPDTDWQPTPTRRLAEFSARLQRRGVTARVREPRGRDIAAACGQLKAEATEGRTLVRLGERWAGSAGGA